MLLCVSGKIEIKFDRVFSENTVILGPGMSVFHSAMEWAEIKFLEENSVMLAACSTDFDPDDYISIYVDFQSLVVKLEQQRKKRIAEQDALLTQVPLIMSQLIEGYFPCSCKKYIAALTCNRKVCLNSKVQYLF